MIESDNILAFIYFISIFFTVISLKTIQYIRTAKFMYLARRTALHITIESKELVISPTDVFEVT